MNADIYNIIVPTSSQANYRLVKSFHGKSDINEFGQPNYPCIQGEISLVIKIKLGDEEFASSKPLSRHKSSSRTFKEDLHEMCWEPLTQRLNRKISRAVLGVLIPLDFLLYNLDTLQVCEGRNNPCDVIWGTCCFGKKPRRGTPFNRFCGKCSNIYNERNTDPKPPPHCQLLFREKNNRNHQVLTGGYLLCDDSREYFIEDTWHTYNLRLWCARLCMNWKDPAWRSDVYE